MNDDHYDLRLLPRDADGGGPHGGVLRAKRNDLNAVVNRARSEWVAALVKHRWRRGSGKPEGYPYADHHDLSDHRDTEDFRLAMRKLAQIGHHLFEYFIRGCDDDGQKLLRELFRSGEQTVTVISDDLLIPWSMLYLPKDDINLDDPKAEWSFDGFLGFRHRLEHTFRDRPQGWKHQIHVSNRVRVAAFADGNIQQMRPVIEFLREKDRCRETDLKVHESRLAASVALGEGPAADELIYFCCHGHPSTLTEQAHLKLTDQQEIFTSDFDIWLEKNRLSSWPIVFVAACQGGQLASLLHSAFGLSFLKHGSNCLVGPQIDIPVAFGREYSKRFLDQVLRGRKVGDVVFDLTRLFVSEFNNPFGLVMSLYRGMDSHFDLRTGAAA